LQWLTDNEGSVKDIEKALGYAFKPNSSYIWSVVRRLREDGLVISCSGSGKGIVWKAVLEPTRSPIQLPVVEVKGYTCRAIDVPTVQPPNGCNEVAELIIQKFTTPLHWMWLRSFQQQYEP
jgi:hypothetical protein